MGLRQNNPLIEADLGLIISTFEKAMVKSRDADSILVSFRRHLFGVEALPSSIKKTVDNAPRPLSPTGSEGDPRNPAQTSSGGDSVGSRSHLTRPSGSQGTPGSNNGSAPERVTTPEEVTDLQGETQEESADDAEWKRKIKELAQDCIPCDFRTLTTMDGEFFGGIVDSWKSALDKAKGSLSELEGLVNGYKDKFTGLVEEAAELGEELTGIVEGDITSPIQNVCDIGNSLKGQCIPDLKKMIFMMESFLTDMENGFSLDLGGLDSFLTALLTPIFNEMLGNLDLIDELALGPVRCILDSIEQQIMRGGEVAEQGYESVSNVAQSRNVVGRVMERRDREDTLSLFRRSTSDSANSSGPASTRTPTRAEELASRAVAERDAFQQRASRSAQSSRQRINRTFEQMREATSFLDRFKRCLQRAFDYLEDKKDWLLNLLEDLVDVGDEDFRSNLSFANNKKDILEYISIMKALVDAAKSGNFSCGPDTNDMTLDELELFFMLYQHPSESLDISVEDGNIVVRRNPDGRNKAPDYSGGGTVNTGAPGTDSSTPGVSNIVVRRPISSCLKRVTADEADQVQQWIRQLE